MLVYCFDEGFKKEGTDEGFHKAAALLRGKIPTSVISCFDKIKFGKKKMTKSTNLTEKFCQKAVGLWKELAPEEKEIRDV